MFDLEDSSWDVDETANKLTSELFGSTQKIKKQKKSRPSKNNCASLPDSDDEVYSKKGKRKLKEWQSKQNKLTKESREAEDDDNAANNFEKDSPKKQNDKKRKKGKKETFFVEEPIDSLLKKQTKKLDKETNNSLENKEVVLKTNKKKRKLVDSEDKDEEKQSPKMSKIKGKGSDSIDENENTEKKKKKRIRKKKNNSKKNKYKHLALSNRIEELSENNDTVKDDCVTVQTNELYDSENIESSTDGENKKGLYVRALPLDTMLAERVNEVEKKNDIETKKPKNVANDIDTNKLKNVASKKNKPVQTKSLEDADNHLVFSEIQKVSKKTKKKNVAEVLVDEPMNSNESPIPTNKSPVPTKIKNNLAEVLDNEPMDSKESSLRKKIKKKKKVKESTYVNNDQNTMVKLAENLDNINGEELIKSETISNARKRKLSHKSEILTKMLNESSLISYESDNSQKTSNKKTKDKTKKSQNSTQLVESADQHSENATDNSKSQNKLQSKTTPVNSIWGKASILAREKLDSARFRFINEQLYTCEGSDAMKMFRADKQSFHVYHDGYRTQVSKWQVNPLDVIIKQFASKSNSLVVADFGCGEAKLAESIPQKVHSFDLVALNKRVTACDMSRTPLSPESVDVAVFCLSLMGTNLVDYIREANRVLKTGGLLKIAEVTSRFSGVTSFISAVCDQGFLILNKRELGQMFYMMDFKKIKDVKKSTATIKLNPCVYKRR